MSQLNAIDGEGGGAEVAADVTAAIRSVYARHDHRAPLNHVNVVEWVDAVTGALATHDAEVLRAAAEVLEHKGTNPYTTSAEWLRERADRIERGDQ